MQMFHQDFTEIVFRKNKRLPNDGPKIEVSKKQKILDDCNDVHALKLFGRENGKLLQSARLNAKLTQEQLANQIHEKKKVINSYENGNIVPDNKVLNKLRNKLNIKFK